jgi:hypothetical protein
MFDELFSEIQAAQAEMSAWRRRLTGIEAAFDRKHWMAARARLGESERRWLDESRARIARQALARGEQRVLSASRH